ncbi:MAG: spore cortex biosynthesis protein YabQ [Velocimicrobium sp.]
MSEMIVSEVHFYLSSFLWGMALVAMYDVLRIFRRIIKHKSLLIALEDLIFWIMAAGLVFRMIYQYNNGIIRFPGMIILFLGMLLYHYGVSNPFVHFINKKIILPIKKVIRMIHKLLKKGEKKVKLFLSRKIRPKQ